MSDSEEKTSVDLFIERIHELGIAKQVLPLVKCNGVQQLMELAFYEGFKLTHSTFNAEIPFVGHEFFDGTDANKEIDECPDLAKEFQELIQVLSHE